MGIVVETRVQVGAEVPRLRHEKKRQKIGVSCAHGAGQGKGEAAP